MLFIFIFGHGHHLLGDPQSCVHIDSDGDDQFVYKECLLFTFFNWPWSKILFV